MRVSGGMDIGKGLYGGAGAHQARVGGYRGWGEVLEGQLYWINQGMGCCMGGVQWVVHGSGVYRMWVHTMCVCVDGPFFHFLASIVATSYCTS